TLRIFCRERLRHLLTNRDRHRRVATGTGIVEVTSEPSGSLETLRVAGSLPDFSRAKVRAIRVRVANALNDGQLPGIIEVFEAGKILVESHLVVEAKDIFLRETDAGAGLAIIIVAVGHNGVEAIIAASHLEHDENGRVLAGSDLRR